MLRNKPLRLLEGDSGGNAAGGQGGAMPPATPPPGEMPPPANGAMPGTTQPQQTLDDVLKELELTRSALKKANDESKTHRLENSELKKYKEQIENEKLSAQEKAEKQLAKIQKEHEDYRTSVQERIVTTELRAQAADLGFADLSDAVRLLDRSELEFDEDGNPTNAHKLLEALAKAKPYLLKQQSNQQQRTVASSGGATNPSRSTTSGPQTLTREYVNALVGDKAAYDALPASEKSRISAWIQAGGLLKRR